MFESHLLELLHPKQLGWARNKLKHSLSPHFAKLLTQPLHMPNHVGLLPRVLGTPDNHIFESHLLDSIRNEL